MNFTHASVMLNESLEFLNVLGSNGTYVDATLGLAGHSSRMLELLGPNARVLGIECDERNLNEASARLAGDRRFKPVHGNFRDMDVLLKRERIEAIDGVLFDLGVSSAHFDDASRGFSFSKEAPLDMRLDASSGITASDVVNKYRKEELERVIREYGEEHKAGKIADCIIRSRPVKTTVELAEIIKRAKYKPGHEKTHPATQVFQAVRIEVNDEINALRQGLDRSLKLLKSGGRIAVISFHSLEDRVVKQLFAREASDCVCENKRMPCNCGHRASLKLLTKKPAVPAQEEMEANPRSRSARLRAAEKI
ncbi:MAG: 16S rRNA (cytosine(1402)-N(4))-methyltransferase RsmH [Spirochaetia bacterium]|nr:16S rRNA (cytosine(1402)-N(4))-methyltransferase RsmH [Spirochaetia bacterium]